jgi:hypothetical protein
VQGYREKHPGSFIHQSTFFTAAAHIERHMRAIREKKNVFVFVRAALLLMRVLQMPFDRKNDKTTKSTWPTIFHHYNTLYLMLINDK